MPFMPSVINKPKRKREGRHARTHVGCRRLRPRSSSPPAPRTASPPGSPGPCTCSGHTYRRYVKIRVKSETEATDRGGVRQTGKTRNAPRCAAVAPEVVGPSLPHRRAEVRHLNEWIVGLDQEGEGIVTRGDRGLHGCMGTLICRSQSGSGSRRFSGCYVVVLWC